MKTNLKTKWMSKIYAGIGMLAVISSFAVAQAQDLENGVYKLNDPDGRQGRMIVKTIASRHALTTYAFVTLDSSALAAIYKVEPVAGSYSFVQLGLSQENILMSNELSQPSYEGQMIPNVKGESVLALNPTATGRQTGCVGTLRFQKDNDSRYTWVDFRGFNGQKLKINKDWHLDLAVTNSFGALPQYKLGLFSGDDINSVYAGSYIINELVPGIGLARRSDLDSTKISGTFMSRGVTFTMVLLNSSKSKERPILNMIRLGSPSTCFSPNEKIK